MLEGHGLHLAVLGILGIVQLLILLRNRSRGLRLGWLNIAAAGVLSTFLFSSAYCHSPYNPNLSGHGAASSAYHPCCAPQLPGTDPIVIQRPLTHVAGQVAAVVVTVPTNFTPSALDSRAPPMLG